jgi:hypothetical protein
MATNEDILNMPDDQLPEYPPESEKSTEEVEEQEPEEEVSEEPEPSEEEPEEEETPEEPAGQRQRIFTSQKSEEDDEEEYEEEDTESLSVSGSDDIDYQAEYEKVFAPLKANGKTMHIDNADDARQLMQMGANYQKKMIALKPHLRMLRALENNDLLSEDKVNFLIDLVKKNPEAITKFLKDSEIDPLDLNLDTDEEQQYAPKSYVPSNAEAEFYDTIEELRDTPPFARFVDDVIKTWDEDSISALRKSPMLIRVLNDHIDTGVFEIIQQTLERERMMGRLNGVNDLDAYKLVGDAIQAKGGFKQLGLGKPAPAKQKQRQVDPKVKRRKQAASPTKGKSRSVAPEDFNPLAMSDEEFEKTMGKVLI